MGVQEMPQVTKNLLTFLNSDSDYDPIELVKEQGACVLTALHEFPERADEIIISLIDVHGMEFIERIPDEYIEREAVQRRIARYKLTTPVSEQQ